MDLTLDQFSYHLPKDRIAQRPAEPRDSSTLMVLHRETGEISQHHFYDLPGLLTKNDVIVRNNTKVLPARLFGKKETGGKVEVLLVRHLGSGSQGEIWEVLTKPRVEIGQRIEFGHGLEAHCKEEFGYTRSIEFSQRGPTFFSTLHTIGELPLPPYIQDTEKKFRLPESTAYQTIYAKHEGSAAAPTAGLHFTENLDHAVKQQGIPIEELTLHVGLGTFLPVKEEHITKHQMHHEWFSLSRDTADHINQYKKEGRRIIAVGTTTIRVLESCADDASLLSPKTGTTDIFIYPPYRFNIVDGLITNFHLPESTLLMLISAFCSAPNTTRKFRNFETSVIGNAYKEAIKHGYRFFSFGDAMLIL